MRTPIIFGSRYLAKKYCKELNINVYTIVKVESDEDSYIIMVPLMFDDSIREREVETTCQTID